MNSRMKKHLVQSAAVLAAFTMVGVISINVTVHSDGHTVYEERTMFMEGMGKSMKAFSDFLKRGEGEPLELAAMAGVIAENAPTIPTLFPENTGMAQNEESEAKSNIWEEWDDFTAAAENLVGKAQALEAAFETGDGAAIGAAVKSLGMEGCGRCHKQFRQKKE